MVKKIKTVMGLRKRKLLLESGYAASAATRLLRTVPTTA